MSFLIVVKIIRWVLSKMFNMNSESKLAGPGYLVLNVLRVCNIISLLLVAVASWVMLVMTVKTSNFFFFDAFTHFITSTISIFLIVSEIPWLRLKMYFVETWPVLSVEYGLTYLGLAMVTLGFNLLGNLNKAATNQVNLGLPLWRVVITGGILPSIFGFFNIIAGWFFSDSNRGLTGRHVRSYGAAPPQDKLTKSFSLNSSSSSRRAPSPVLPIYNAAQEDRRKSRFGRLKFPIRVSRISKPVLNDDEQFSKWDERSSPIAPAVQRPETALHPAYRAPPEPNHLQTPPSPSSRYSEVTTFTRF